MIHEIQNRLLKRDSIQRNSTLQDSACGLHAAFTRSQSYQMNTQEFDCHTNTGTVHICLSAAPHDISATVIIPFTLQFNHLGSLTTSLLFVAPLKWASWTAICIQTIATKQPSHHCFEGRVSWGQAAALSSESMKSKQRFQCMSFVTRWRKQSRIACWRVSIKAKIVSSCTQFIRSLSR